MIKPRLFAALLVLAAVAAAPAVQAAGPQGGSGYTTGDTTSKRKPNPEDDPRNCRPWCWVSAD
jgi:hypothetical protein